MTQLRIIISKYVKQLLIIPDQIVTVITWTVGWLLSTQFSNKFFFLEEAPHLTCIEFALNASKIGYSRYVIQHVFSPKIQVRVRIRFWINVRVRIGVRIGSNLNPNANPNPIPKSVDFNFLKVSL